MSRVFHCGFENNGTGEWTTVSGATVVSSPVRTGTYAIECIGGNEYALYSHGTSYQEWYGGFGFRWTHGAPGAGTQFFMIIDSGGTPQLSLAMHWASGHIHLHRGNDAADLLVTATLPCKERVWHYLEFYVKIADSGGRFVLKVDGVTHIDFTGDTRAGTADCNAFRYGASGTLNNAGVDCWFDDIVLNSVDGTAPQTYPGRVGIQMLKPNGAGSYTQCAPLSDANYQMVDEVQADGDTTYVYDDTVDQKDTYAHEALTATAGTVGAVRWNGRARVVSSTGNYAMLLRQGATDFQGVDRALTTSYARAWACRSNDPTDSAAWTIAKVNSIEIGFAVR